MKVVLFCGGQGQRIGSSSSGIAKPLVTIGPYPIIYHLMNYYAKQGHNDFILCLGHYGESIRRFFLEGRPHHASDATLHFKSKLDSHSCANPPDWKITFVDTGLHSSIGQRLVQVRKLVENESIFLANYTDVLSNLPLNSFINDFESSGATGSFISVRPDYSSHGVFADENGLVDSIVAAKDMNLWINGGFMAFRPEIFDYIMPGEDLVEEPFLRLAAKKQLWTHQFTNYWRAMDTLKDNLVLQKDWEKETPPWLDVPHQSSTNTAPSCLTFA